MADQKVDDCSIYMPGYAMFHNTKDILLWLSLTDRLLPHGEVSDLRGHCMLVSRRSRGDREKKDVDAEEGEGGTCDSPTQGCDRSHEKG